MGKDVVSLIIPVHNAEKYLDKRMEDIFRQDYPSLEIILVENGSKDQTYEKCKIIAKGNDCVKAYRNDLQGTSLARKRGVQEARGKYILFSDQDDYYVDRHAITNMVQAIQEDNSQICQFSHYNQYLPGLRRKRTGNRKKIKYTREELMNEAISGVLGQPDGIFDTTVWSKIYDADVLKAAVQNIDKPMFYAEDLYLNMLAFFNESVKSVSVRPEAYYVWKTGIGFSSSSGSGKVLFREYEQVNRLAETIAQEYELPAEIVRKCHIGTLYFHKKLVLQIWDETQDEELCLKEVAEMEAMPHLNIARSYVQKLSPKEIWDELAFMADRHSPEEFLHWCRQNRPAVGKKERILGMLAKLRNPQRK